MVCMQGMQAAPANVCVHLARPIVARASGGERRRVRVAESGMGKMGIGGRRMAFVIVCVIAAPDGQALPLFAAIRPFLH